jgi:hypothetical protein
MNIATLTFDEVVDYVTTHATNEELEELQAAMNARNSILQAQRAAAVRVGSTVTFVTIAPKYMEGLTGEITSIDGKHATVRLNVRSTNTLRVKGRRRFFIPPTTQRYEVSGIPLTCCAV